MRKLTAMITSLKVAEKVSDRHSACGAGVSIEPGA